MQIENSFVVSVPPPRVWDLLLDVTRVAQCMPGAELTEVVDARNYKGKISVRLGPVALAFAGRVEIDAIDDANRSAKVKAQGSDAKGRGSANATATFHLEPANGGSKVLVHTNLTLSGAVAQYGRGVGIIQMTAAQIITQFANNLKAQLGPASPALAPAAAPVAAPAATPAPDRAGAQPPAPAVAAPTAPAKPISGFALMSAVLLAWIKRLFGRG